MTIGVGGFSQAEALESLQDMTLDIKPISMAEYQARITKAQDLMKQQGLAAIFVNAGTNLKYFTGTQWYPSERLVGALITVDGVVEYIVPNFEIDSFKGFQVIEAPINDWHEHQSPYDLVVKRLDVLGIQQASIGIDESAPFFVFDGLREASAELQWVAAKSVTAGCRMQKSPAELALMQRAKDMTLQVHQATAKIIKPGISTQEVTDFINRAHQRVGASGSSFCIVLFGGDTAYPHGVKTPKCLEENDMVLIDTGCLLHGYNSDITRSYVFGEANARQREIWSVEKEAQAKAFAAAQLGIACGEVDLAARNYLTAQGFGPEYQLPGLPHRTGHGIGLDIHEWPYLVSNDTTPLAPGMCFSNEPMMVVPGEFGVRLEDHFYMTDSGPRWFTQPSHSIDDPFGYSCQSEEN